MAPESEGAQSSPSLPRALEEGAANDVSAPARPMLSKGMEDEIYSLLGALLGLLEVLSIDAEPLSPRQRRLLEDALRFGDQLRARVEALVTLFSDDQDQRFIKTPYALRRLIDHAVRAASWAAAEKGVRIVLPEGELVQTQLLLVDAGRVDRALRAITDTLVFALGKDGEVELNVEDKGDNVRLTLAAHAKGRSAPSALSLSAILLSAWEHVFRTQRGSLKVAPDALSVVMELPKASPGEQR